MRSLQIDIPRALAIVRRSQDASEILRIAAERERDARRHLNHKQRELTLLQASPIKFEAHAREDRNNPFIAGKAAQEMAVRDVREAKAALESAIERKRYAAAEAEHLNSLARQILEHFGRTESRTSLPPELRKEI